MKEDVEVVERSGNFQLQWLCEDGELGAYLGETLDLLKGPVPTGDDRAYVLALRAVAATKPQRNGSEGYVWDTESAARRAAAVARAGMQSGALVECLHCKGAGRIPKPTNKASTAKKGKARRG